MRPAHALLRSMGMNALILGGFALASVALVAATWFATRDTIAAARRAALEASLNALVPAARYDNHPAEDVLRLAPPGAPPLTVYRARKGGVPVAVLATVTAPDGYSGPIQLLVGVWADGRLAGVRVLAHKETPGLGDAIEVERSPWIHGFDGRSLDDPPRARWKVRKDGGDFDQFTGATITPRAVVKAVQGFLDYYAGHREALFAPATTETRP